MAQLVIIRQKLVAVHGAASAKNRLTRRAIELLTFNSVLLAPVNSQMSVVASHMGTRLILSTLLLLSRMLLLGIAVAVVFVYLVLHCFGCAE